MSGDPITTIPAISAGIEQGRNRSWSLEEGEAKTIEFRGVYSDLETLYDGYVGAALEGTINATSVNLRGMNGRASLSVAIVDQSYTGGNDPGERVVGIEEILPIDITKDVAAAPMYSTLPSEAIVLVKTAIAELLDAEDAAQSFDGFTEPQIALMFDLWKRYAHGETVYLETAFILRRTYITKSDLIVTDLLGSVNTVIDNDTLLAKLNPAISSIVSAIPSGEWLVRTPEVSFQGKGRYHVKEEYQWAVKWSDLYGGTLSY